MFKVILFIASIFVIATVSVFADTQSERFAKEMAKYKQTNVFENCVQHNRIKRTNVLDDNHILFEMRNNKYFLNTLDHKCSRLGFERSIAYTVRTSKLCSYDIVSVFDPIGMGPGCFLGKFEVLEKLPRGRDW